MGLRGFVKSNLMQFYVQLWIDTGLTFTDLGEWERRNPEEYDVYMAAYSERCRLIDERLKNGS